MNTLTRSASATGTRHFAGLAANKHGSDDGRPPVVLLHGLTFDRSMWRPALDELAGLDPRRRVLALDLPGHGESASRPATAWTRSSTTSTQPSRRRACASRSWSAIRSRP